MDVPESTFPFRIRLARENGFRLEYSLRNIEEFKKLPPLERLGQAEDIAGVVSFLAGPDGGWVNAQILRANGGFA